MMAELTAEAEWIPRCDGSVVLVVTLNNNYHHPLAEVWPSTIKETAGQWAVNLIDGYSRQLFAWRGASLIYRPSREEAMSAALEALGSRQKFPLD